MIPFYSAASSREADRMAMDRLGIPPSLLMENAGKGAADALLRRYGRSSWVILCGPGNNGGDGFVLARHLKLAGCDVTVLLSQERGRFAGDPGSFLRMLEKLNTPIEETSCMEDDALINLFASSGGIVDALLGTGSSGAPRGECKRLLSLVPGQGPVLVSLDIPSGVDASTGEVPSIAFHAELTLTFLAPKIGLRVLPGALFAGNLETIPIGVPAEAVLPPPELEGYGGDDAALDWPTGHFDDHKGKAGTVLVIGGSSRYRGAPLLAARGSLRSGAGLVVLLVPECVASAGAVGLPEAILVPLPVAPDGGLEPDAVLAALADWKERAGALVVGPGLGRFDSTASLVSMISGTWEKPVVYDADALFFLSARPLSHFSIITPHEGEAARLLKKKTPFVSSSRLQAVRDLAESYGPSLLKGPFSLCSDGERTGAILESTPALAVPGSGDVLSGVTGTLLAKGLPPFKAGLAAAFVHANAGLLLSRKQGSTTGIFAREIADALPLAIPAPANRAGITSFRCGPLPGPRKERHDLRND